MNMDRPVPQISLGEQRERTVAALCEHFAGDRLELEEFEARLDRAHRARSATELSELLQDLPAPRRNAVAGGSSQGDVVRDAVARGAAAMGAAVRDMRTMVAFMGGVERRGAWTPARRNLVVAVMGGAELDFRDVVLPPGETEIVLFCFMGGAEIIVPPGLAVDANGIAIMGGFAQSTPGRRQDADAPVLKLTGIAFMGGVDISERHAGESKRDAELRRRDDRLERKRQPERRLPPDAG
jgi:hypothetical protein